MKNPKSKTVMKQAIVLIGETATARAIAHRDIEEMAPKKLAQYHLDAASALLKTLETEFYILDGDDVFSSREALQVIALCEQAAARLQLIRNLVREVSP
jgi:hypothetical protein